MRGRIRLASGTERTTFMPPSSLVETAYQSIRQKLLRGELLFGTLLSENELAEELHMSRTPIRSAISKLESEGFVTSLKNRGILVKQPSSKEMLDVLEMVMFLQMYALEIVEERGYTIDLKQLQELLTIQLQAAEQNNYYEYIISSYSFYQVIIEASSNQGMLQVMDSYRDKLVMYSMVYWRLTPTLKHYSANLLNERILEAITAMDYAGAKRIWKQFITSTRERFLLQGSI